MSCLPFIPIFWPWILHVHVRKRIRSRPKHLSTPRNSLARHTRARLTQKLILESGIFGIENSVESILYHTYRYGYIICAASLSKPHS